MTKRDQDKIVREIRDTVADAAVRAVRAKMPPTEREVARQRVALASAHRRLEKLGPELRAARDRARSLSAEAGLYRSALRRIRDGDIGEGETAQTIAAAAVGYDPL